MTTTTLSAEAFEFIRTMVREHSGIVLDPGKEYLVETRLQTVVRRQKMAGIDRLVEHLRAAPFSDVHRLVVEAMTTNETSFFRDEAFFEALRQGVFPWLIERRRSTRELSLWCAASSSGQEPYSVLMLLREHFPELVGWRIRFLCTDLSQEMVARTKCGVYSQHEVNRGLPARLLVKYFERSGLEWQAKKELRDMLEVREFNLVLPWPQLPQVDIVFVRNVLIYFDLDTKKHILARIKQLIRPDGVVFLGAAETTFNIDVEFRRGPVERGGCYQRSERKS